MLKENAIRIDVEQCPTQKFKLYVFLCSSCSKEIRVQSGSLKRHKGKCVVCSGREQMNRILPAALEVTRKRPYEAMFNWINGFADRRGLSHGWSYEHFCGLMNQRSCHYCAKELETLPPNGFSWSGYQVDRKDNDRGYEENNTVRCCDSCNRRKHTKSYDDFVELLYDKHTAVTSGFAGAHE